MDPPRPTPPLTCASPPARQRDGTAEGETIQPRERRYSRAVCGIHRPSPPSRRPLAPPPPPPPPPLPELGAQGPQPRHVPGPPPPPFGPGIAPGGCLGPRREPARGARRVHGLRLARGGLRLRRRARLGPGCEYPGVSHGCTRGARGRLAPRLEETRASLTRLRRRRCRVSTRLRRPRPLVSAGHPSIAHPRGPTSLDAALPPCAPGCLKHGRRHRCSECRGVWRRRSCCPASPTRRGWQASH